MDQKHTKTDFEIDEILLRLIIISKSWLDYNFKNFFFSNRMMKTRVRKGFRNFILSRIAKSHRNQEFLDATFQTSETDSDLVMAHKLVLASLSPILNEVMQNDGEETLIILPDFKSATIRIFTLLAYGLLNPESIDSGERSDILELCQVIWIALEFDI